MPQNQKGVAHIFIVLIILTGIAIGFYLVQNRQIFNPKASETVNTSAVKIDDAAFESIYNPFGDPWSLKKASNPSIPISFSTGCYKEGEKGTTDEIPEREIEYLSKTNAPIIYIDCAAVQDENYMLPRYEKLKTFIQKIKAKNPQAKIIGYLVLHEGQPVFPTIVKDADNGDETMESFLVHKKGLPATKDNRVSGRPDHPEWGYAAVMDITNSQYRAYAVPKIVNAMQNMGLDGVLIDGIYWNPLKGLGIADLIPDQTITSWPAAQAQFIQELKSAVGNEKLLFANVRLDEVAYISNDLLRDGRLDGIMLEDPIGPESNEFIPGNYRYDYLKQLLSLAKERDKYVWVVVNTNINCTDSGPNCFTTTTDSAQRRYMNYYLSSFLHIFDSPKQMLIYYTPIQNRPQFLSETFFREWDLTIGEPTSPSEQIGNGIYGRRFQNAYVVLNTTYNNFSMPETVAAEFFAPDGTAINRATIPAKQGIIFTTQPILTEWNALPVSASIVPHAASDQAESASSSSESIPSILTRLLFSNKSE